MSASLVSPVFVGRQSERAELVEALQRAVDGVTQFVLVGGEAGVGKSRLVAELVADAETRRVRVLSGHCVQLGRDGLPFAPLVDALRELARSMPREEFDRVLGPARRAMLRLLPNIDPEPDDVPIEPILQGSQLPELVLGLLERLASAGPVLMVIEDLHWADQGTLDLVAHLVRALRGFPVAVVGTFRSDELSRRHPLRSLLLAWEQGRSVRSLELHRFDRAEVGDQLTAILGREPSPSVASTVFERSEGNAFLVEEMLGVLLAGADANALPKSLRDMLLSRVDAVGPEARRLLTTAAVGGRWVHEELLLLVSGLEESAAFAGLHEAVEQHLLVVDDAGRGYTFRHALTRDAVYDDMLPGERGRLHASYGELLTARPELAGDDRGTLAADVAHHWYVALDLPRALAASIEAASSALDRFAPAEALRQLERVLHIWPRVPDAEAIAGVDHVEVLERCAQVASDIGEVHRTSSLVFEALEELGEDGEPVRRARLLERQGTALHQAGKTAQSLRALRRAADLLPAEGFTQTHARVFNELATAMWRAGRWDEASALGRRAAIAAEATSADRQRAEAEITLALVQVMTGDLDGSLPRGKAAIELALGLGHVFVALRGYINLSYAPLLLGRSAEAAGLAREGRLIADRFGYARSLGAFLAANEAEGLTHLGSLDEAAELLSSMLAAEPQGVFAATVLHERAQVALRQGQFDVARSLIARGRALVGDHEFQSTRSFAFSDARLRLAEGDESAALGVLRTALTSLDTHGLRNWDWILTWLALRTHADIAQLARDRGDAAPVVDPVFSRALEKLTAESDLQRAYQAMCAAESSRAQGAHDAEIWEAAAERWRRLDRPHEQAECLLRAAQAHALNRDRARAELGAAEAFKLAFGMGAVPLGDAVAQFARRARLNVMPSGAAPTSPADSISDDAVSSDELRRVGLTQREREVLAMVAEGSTNPEIAKKLYISPKTASVHVSNILAKLGVSSRVEAATMAYRLGLVAS